MDKVPADAKVLTSTWAMKQKANGTKHARLNARGYEQVDGEHYNEDSKAAPVVCEATIHIILLDHYDHGMLGGRIVGHSRTFEKGWQIYMKVLQGFEK